MKHKVFFAVIAASLMIFSTLGVHAQNSKTADRAVQPDNSYNEYVLKEVGTIHGVAGPFAVAGYRIGARAMLELQKLKGSFDLDATHNTVAEVHWSCIADVNPSGDGCQHRQTQSAPQPNRKPARRAKHRRQ